MAVEFKKVANNYFEYNQEKVFGSTSWATVHDLFPEGKMEEKSLVGNSTTIDSSKHN